jgi:hypothetical protein
MHPSSPSSIHPDMRVRQGNVCVTDIAILGNEVHASNPPPTQHTARLHPLALSPPHRTAANSFLRPRPQVPSTLSSSYLPQEFAQMERTKCRPRP